MSATKLKGVYLFIELSLVRIVKGRFNPCSEPLYRHESESTFNNTYHV